MKRYLAGMVSGVFLFLLFSDLFLIYEDKISYKYYNDGWSSEKYARYVKENPTISTVASWFNSPSTGLKLPFTGSCTSEKLIIYFDCNKLQIILSDLLYE